jgi:glycosyltransferase involved in cell wall biosynthesis
MTACAVLHVTPVPGGGIDRHVRDIAAGAAREHYLWHAADGAHVLEQPREPRFLPLAADAPLDSLAASLRARGVGLVHLHTLARAARERAAAISQALAAPTVLTLHDVLFLGPERFESPSAAPPAAAWRQEVEPALHGAAQVIAPSAYIAGLAREHFGIEARVIPNGIDLGTNGALAPRRAFTAGAAGRRVVALLGALGPHKGSRLVEALARRLAGSDTVLVVIGYTDSQAWPGWFDDHLFIHGPYEDHQAGAWLAAYGAEVALFPNTVPESFSYALSEAWAAKVPAIVPPEGALGERVGRHGGGWVLPRGFGVDEVAALLARLGTKVGRDELARVKSSLDGPDPDRLPRLPAMNAALEELYRRHGVDPSGPVDPLSPPAQALLAAQLDSRLFRHDLIVLTEQLGLMREGPDAERRAARKFELEARGWIAKLEADVQSLQDELRREFALRQAVEQAPLASGLRSRLAALVPAGLRRALRGRRD